MSERVAVLTGGVGGAKLVLGLTQVMPADGLTIIVNTGDDFQHLGLSISPDLDTLLYTLSGRANREQGWGRESETWSFMAALRSLGGEDWFALGDGDLALHLVRTQRLIRGETLTSITQDVARKWGIGATILPMSDDPVRTVVMTEDSELPFQRYFVQHQCEPRVRALRFSGASEARAAPGVLEALRDASTILIAPSNPYLSIDPILAVPGIRDTLAEGRAPIIAVSPIIGGSAVKGPTAKLMHEFGITISPVAIARHYDGVIDGLLVDERDLDVALPLTHHFADTLMVDLDDRARVARAALKLAAACA
jgi:LPPG:FO 2-phospho-L-lactate transferase